MFGRVSEFGRLTHQQRLDALAPVRRQRAELDATETELLAVIVDDDPFLATGHLEALEKDFTGEEVACVLQVPSATARDALVTADRLVWVLPDSVQAMREGWLPGQYARKLAQDTEELHDDAAAGKVQAIVLAKAARQTYSQFCYSLRRAIAELDTRDAAERHELARTTRGASPPPRGFSVVVA